MLYIIKNIKICTVNTSVDIWRKRKMGQIKWTVSGEVPPQVVKDFERFMNEEALKINAIIRKDLDEWLKPLPEILRNYFNIGLVVG
jgi:hypothetical protein